MNKLFASRGLKGLALVSVVLICGFLVLYRNVSPILETSVTEQIPVLDKSLSPEVLADHLLEKGYLDDPADAACISDWIVSQLQNRSVSNLGALNKDPFRIPVTLADSLGGAYLHSRCEASRMTVGQTESQGVDPDTLATVFSCAGERLHTIPVFVREENPVYSNMTGTKGRILKRVYRTFKKDYYQPVEGVVIRIEEHDLDNRDGIPVGYMKTGPDGCAAFRGVEGHFYSLLPIEPGYEFGSSFGTRKMDKGLDRDLKTVVRTRKVHTIRLFDSFTYGRIKEDHALIVRSAASYRKAMVLGILIFLAFWCVFYVLLGVFSGLKKKGTDYLLPLLLMTITGIDILCMFSIADPLTDSLLGTEMVRGIVAGLLLMAAVSMMDWGRFFHLGLADGQIEFDFVLQFIRYLEKPFPEKVATLQAYSRAHQSARPLRWALVLLRYYVCLLLSVILLPLEWLMRLISYFPKKWGLELPKGSGYLLIVLLLILLLALFGDGPEGSGTKVNLFFFQPSELNKYLVVLFMAVFFSRNASRIQTFSETLTPGFLKMQIRTVAFIVLTIGLLLVLYMGVMSDMGPALVIIITFILLYSIARRDVGAMLLGVATYLALTYLARLLPGNPLWGQILVAVIWLVFWVLGGYFKSGRLYESAIFFNLVLFAFISGGDILAGIGMENEAQRLLDRKQVAESLWNNDVTGGGDQVVQGIWSLATGGLTGQGLGKGDPNLVPAFNTDMVFTSIGEEMGFVALLLLIVCMAILLHRCLIIGYWSGDSFLFFLAAGIALVTGVQFFIIVLGSLGLIPLTGVAVPFLSYGMTSMILNLGGMGILLSISGRKKDASLLAENAGYSQALTTTSVWGFLGLSLVVLAVLFNYQGVRRNHYLVKPTYVCNEQGVKQDEFNPRIRKLLRALESGDIFDRNGLLLATSNREELTDAQTRINQVFAGSSTGVRLSERTDTLKRKYLQRYYPFGSDLFFMLGDVNTMTLWGILANNPFGYLAEDRHRAELVGFQTAVYKDGKVDTVQFDARYRVSPFLPKIDTTYVFDVRDYSDRRLLKMLRQGRDGSAVRRWNEKKNKRDLYLTVDARLQTVMQDKMGTYMPSVQEKVSNSLKRNYSHPGGRALPSQKVRASVVVLDAQSGDLLTSAVYPLPDQRAIKDYLDQRKDYSVYEREPSSLPFTDRDLGLTFLTQPGSTAKVMSSIAAFIKEGDDAAKASYTITSSQGIGHDAAGTYTMRSGLVSSVNAYFISLVNDKDLYLQLDTLYSLVGNQIGDDMTGGYQKSYFFYPGEFTTQQRQRFNSFADAVHGRAIQRYEEYVRTRSTAKMNVGDWGWSWGQGTLRATPLSMARVASIVADGGSYVPTRYVLGHGKGGEKVEWTKPEDPIRVISRHQSDLLVEYMREETSKHRASGYPLPHSMGGKTGTPERGIHFKDDPRKKGERINDAWYLCFVDVVSPESGLVGSEQRRIAIAVRLERTYGYRSGEAVSFVSKVVVPALREAGYRVLDVTE